MTRSLKKGPYIDQKLLEKVKKLKELRKDEPIKTWARDCIISPEMVGFTFLVHNGKEFISVKANESVVGHKLGEFSPTTKFFRHGGRIQKELEIQEAQKEAEKLKEEKPKEAAPPAKK